jgi:hypothetical protein
VRCVRFYEGSLGFDATVGDATSEVRQIPTDPN